jgi:hypothetical protein
MLTIPTGNPVQTEVWQRAFDPEDRQHLLDEDSEAFRGVTGILIFLASAGLVLGIASVVAILCL